MFSLIYDILLHIFLILMLPKVLYRSIKSVAYRESIKQRFGFNFPVIEKGSRRFIWIHAVSMGETKAIAPMVQRLRKEDPRAIIMVSNVTETGHAEALRALPGADFKVFFPVDTSYVMKKLMKRYAPDLVLLCETDFWYHFLYYAKCGGAKIALLNGKVSSRSLKRYRFFNSFSRRLFSLFDCIALQTESYARAFESLGIAKEKLCVTGNMKYDGNDPAMPKEQLDEWRSSLGIHENDPVLVIGSTHHPEEDDLLGVLAPLWEEFPDLKIILVPRHPQRFEQVRALLNKKGIPFSSIEKPEQSHSAAKLILLDVMGRLRDAYQLADVAIVGGSFTPIGGHNVLEPVWYGVPVIFGPHMHSQKDMLALVAEYNVGQSLSLDKVFSAVKNLLSEPSRRALAQRSGEKMFQDIQGSLERTWNCLEEIM